MTDVEKRPGLVSGGNVVGAMATVPVEPKTAWQRLGNVMANSPFVLFGVILGFFPTALINAFLSIMPGASSTGLNGTEQVYVSNTPMSSGIFMFVGIVMITYGVTQAVRAWSR